MWLRSAYFIQDAGRRWWSRRWWTRTPTLRELCEEIESILARLRIIDVEELPEAAQEAYMNLIAKEQVFTYHAEALLAPFHVPNRRFRRYLADCLELMSREISAFEDEFGVPGAEGFGEFLIRKVDGQKGRARE